MSDNSSNDEVERMVRHEFPDVNFVRRKPTLPALAHFNRCIDEVQTDYFCLFHDDDLMNPDFVSEVKKQLRNHPDAIALGCNAHIESFGKRQTQPSFRSISRVEAITTSRALAARYFSRSQSGIAPFPGYVYKNALVGTLRFHPEGGKYSDVTWLLKLATRAPIIWINQPLMTYRLHASNDGNSESRRDRLRFLGYLKSNKPLFGAGILQDYRCSFIYKTVLNAQDESHRLRHQLATAFVKSYRCSRYARASTYLALAKRALVKWGSKP